MISQIPLRSKESSACQRCPFASMSQAGHAYLWRANAALPRAPRALLREGLAPAAAHLPAPLGLVRALQQSPLLSALCTLANTTKSGVRPVTAGWQTATR